MEFGRNAMDMTDLIFLALGMLILGFIAVPIAYLLLQISDLGRFVQVITRREVLDAVKNTLMTAFATTIISVLFGVPLGYVLARKDFPGKSLVQGIIDVPIVIPHSVVGIMLVLTFSSKIVDNYIGIVLAMLFVSASFTINSARDGFLSVDERLEHVARTLGAGKFRTFLTISLPLAMPSIVSGAIMTFARAMSEVGAILIVAYYPKTAQILVMDYFENYGLKEALPLAALLVLIGLLLFAPLRYILSRRELWRG